MSESFAARRGVSPTAAAGDTLARRWDALAPYADHYGASGEGPLVVLFHGCGGVREHLEVYAEAAVAAGCEAVVVDSFAARGWSRAFGLAFVCTGLMLHGRERAGDVLASVWGLAEGRADRPVVLAGWSHGAWSIMDLMTMSLTDWGEAGLADPDPGVLDAVKGLFLAYPYGGVGALSRVRPWVRSAPVLAVVPSHDHVTSIDDARRLYDRPRAAGAAVDLWEVEATHAFDEGAGVFPMRFDAALRDESVTRYIDFIRGACDL
jgi:dienelactone hydrolase